MVHTARFLLTVFAGALQILAAASVSANDAGHPNIVYVMDFNELKTRLSEVLEPFDHQHLNETEPFAPESGQNPTCENLARVLYQRLAEALKGEGIGVARVRLWETPSSAVTYSECG